jgi:LuxR family maltose regulon positive regulatory protein
MDAQHAHPPLSALRGEPRSRLLRPRLDTRAIARPRLLQRIAAPRVAPVTAIIAPAGFGKTTLAAQWLADADRAVAWIALEPEDDTPARCLHILVAALRRVDPAVGAASLAILATDPPPAPDQVGAALADDLRRIATPWALVIDDLHVLTHPDTHTLLAGALRTPLPHGHLLLTSRTPLPAALREAIGGDRLVTIDAADLRFDDAETCDLAIAVVGADPGPAALARLRDIGNGWAACTRLLLGRLRDAAPADAVPAGLDADADEVVDWLIDRALDHLPPAARSALLHGAISPIVCDDLLAALGPAAPTPVRLDDVAGDDVLFVAVGDGWRRYQPLVRAALLRRFAREHPLADRDAAHRRAGAWFAARGMLADAVHHALAAGDPADAAALVERAGFAALADDRWDHLDEALDLLPDAVVRQQAGALALRCWRDYHRRLYPDRDDLAAATALLADPATSLDAATRDRLAAHVSAFAALLAFDPGDIGGLLASMRVAADRLGATDPGPCGILVGLAGMLAGMVEGAAAGLAFLDERLAAAAPAEATHLLGARGWLLEIVAGDPAAAAAALEAARDAALRAGLPGAAAFAATRLGWLAVRRCDLPAAAAAFADAGRDEALLAINTWRMLASGRAMVALLAGDGDAADALAEEVVRITGRTRQIGAIENSRSFQARLWIMQRKVEPIATWLPTIALEVEQETPILPESVGITWIRALLLTPTPERLARAAGLIDRLLAVATANRLPLVVDAALLCRVGWFVASADSAAARRLLRKLVVRAAGRDDVLLLVEHGPLVRPLLRGMRWQPCERAYVDRVLAALEPLAARWPDPGVFSRREQQVLELIVAGLTFEQIAERLYLTPGTARFHASRVYRVLGVGAYRDVAARARALGLVATD